MLNIRDIIYSCSYPNAADSIQSVVCLGIYRGDFWKTNLQGLELELRRSAASVIQSKLRERICNKLFKRKEEHLQAQLRMISGAATEFSKRRDHGNAKLLLRRTKRAHSADLNRKVIAATMLKQLFDHDM